MIRRRATSILASSLVAAVGALAITSTASGNGDLPQASGRGIWNAYVTGISVLDRRP